MSEALLAEFPFIDMVCSGEGEEAFVSVLQFNELGRTTRLHPNIRTRSIPDSVAGRKPSPPQKTDIESLAAPDYDDYFSQLSSVLGSQDVHPRVLLETSRGCWWGEKAHCTFCGLNGASMAFRSKSAEKALSEITTLRDKHPEAPISVVDNIMDYRYFKTLLPMLAKENIDIELFYETKANLTKDQLKAMRAAGISRIQPGIESLSSPVLRLMRKGVKAIQNVCLLKWCFEESVRPEWNFLWGFPDEDPAEYHSMASLVPHLRHLTPPLYASSIRLERFSPLYEHRDKEAIVHVRPYGAYGDVYDVSESRLGELAYYFEFEYLKHPEISSYTKDLHAEIEQWNLDHPHCYLIYSLTSTGTLVFDGREPGNRKILKFSPASQHIFQVTENPISIKALIAGLPENEDAEFHQTLVQDLIRQGILVFIDGLLFNIAVELSAAQTYPNFAYSAFINDLNRLDTKSFTLPGIRRMVTGIPSCTSRSNIAFQALKKVVTVHPPPWKGEGQGQCR